jgi:hypothetical protein
MDAITRPQVRFQVEKFSDVYEEALSLQALHWREIAPYQDLTRINPDLRLYKTLEASGKLQVATARAGAELVGYFVNMVHPHPHYQHIITAVEDLHFLHPDHRQGWTGVRLLKFGERIAREAGVKLMVGRAKAASGHGVLYRRLGYDLMDEVFTKRLDLGG